MRRCRRERTILVAVRPRWGRPTLRKPIADELPAVPGLVVLGACPVAEVGDAARELAAGRPLALGPIHAHARGDGQGDRPVRSEPHGLDEEQRERARVELRRAVESVNPFKGMSAAARRRYRERGL